MITERPLQRGKREYLRAPSGLCAACGMPLDAKVFDDWRIVALPQPGEQQLLARFELPAEYCGTLEYFSQFTDAFARNKSRVRTPGLRWQLLENGKPLYPYTDLQDIVNPWGYGSFHFAIRLTEGALIEFIARRAGLASAEDIKALKNVTRIGGRIVGRYWYNRAYGGFEVEGGA